MRPELIVLGTAAALVVVTTLVRMSMSYSDWREYRRRRNVCLIVYFLGFVGAVALVALLERYFSSDLPALAVIGTWMLGWVVAAQRWASLRCPACSRWFFHRWLYSSVPIGRRCVHCGLRKWAIAPPDRPNSAAAAAEPQR
jgi:hypothetical protein